MLDAGLYKKWNDQIKAENTHEDDQRLHLDLNPCVDIPWNLRYVYVSRHQIIFLRGTFLIAEDRRL